MSGRTFLNGTLLPDNCKHASCCTVDICPLSYAFIEHSPNLGATVFFIALFAGSLIAQLGLGIFFRTWYFGIALCCGLFLEVIGYAGRLMLRSNPFDFNGFLIYLIPLTIGPAFICAGIYVCLGRIVVVYGEGISRLRPSAYTFIFVSSDLLSLVLQATGGAVTSMAPDDNPGMKQNGIDIMLAGLASQVISLVLFMILCADFGAKIRKSNGWNAEHRDIWSSKRWTYFLLAIAIATLTILVRSAFRVAELSQGFSGSLANSEITFLILEGAMVSIACIALSVAHPGYSFKNQWSELRFTWRKSKADSYPLKTTHVSAMQPGMRNLEESSE